VNTLNINGIPTVDPPNIKVPIIKKFQINIEKGDATAYLSIVTKAITIKNVYNEILPKGPFPYLKTCLCRSYIIILKFIINFTFVWSSTFSDFKRLSGKLTNFFLSIE